MAKKSRPSFDVTNHCTVPPDLTPITIEILALALFFSLFAAMLLLCFLGLLTWDTRAECLPAQAAHDALADAWDPRANHTLPCGSREHCSGIISPFTSSFTAAANARINATRGVLEFDKMMEAQ